MINLQVLKYEPQNLKTQFNKKEYYDFIDSKYNKLFKKTPTKYILTNGANVNFVSGMGGTNNAITELGKKINNENLFFNHNNIELKFNSCDSQYNDLYEDKLIIKTIIQNDNQKIKFNNESYCAGSVFLSEPFKLDENKDKTIYGKKIKVFHIKGINWNDVENKNKNNEKYSILLVKTYYKSILDYFFNENNDDEVLHLVQTPGMLFGGTYHTTLGLINAIKDKLTEIDEKNINITNNKLLTVDVDFEKQIDDKDGGNMLNNLENLVETINKKVKPTLNNKKLKPPNTRTSSTPSTPRIITRTSSTPKIITRTTIPRNNNNKKTKKNIEQSDKSDKTKSTYSCKFHKKNINYEERVSSVRKLLLRELNSPCNEKYENISKNTESSLNFTNNIKLVDNFIKEKKSLLCETSYFDDKNNKIIIKIIDLLFTDEQKKEINKLSDISQELIKERDLQKEKKKINVKSKILDLNEYYKIYEEKVIIPLCNLINNDSKELKQPQPQTEPIQPPEPIQLQPQEPIKDILEMLKEIKKQVCNS